MRLSLYPSIHSVYTIFPLSMSFSPESVHQFGSLYIFFSNQCWHSLSLSGIENIKMWCQLHSLFDLTVYLSLMWNTHQLNKKPFWFLFFIKNTSSIGSATFCWGLFTWYNIIKSNVQIHVIATWFNVIYLPQDYFYETFWPFFCMCYMCLSGLSERFKHWKLSVIHIGFCKAWIHAIMLQTDRLRMGTALLNVKLLLQDT